MPADLNALTEDLKAETALLVDVLAGLDESEWGRLTPADGWTVRDQVTHLAYFDEAAVQAAIDPETFRKAKAEALRDVNGMTGSVARRYRDMAGSDALAWMGRARDELVRVYAQVDPAARIPWYGPDMGPASALTARVMETWAHGQDIIDALGVSRRGSPGLRQIAHLGVRTFANSFVSHRRPVPESPVRVALVAPDGTEWSWGPDDAPDEVRGPAVDFCLVVTQRRHPSDTALVARGSVAEDWLSVAQAFAGPPGPGRQPGQFDG